MKALLDKIKTILFNSGGLPGLNQDDYMDRMRQIVLNELSDKEKKLLNKNHIRIESVIIELSGEIADEIL